MKNFLKVCIIIIFSSVILFLSINNVSALTIYHNNNEITLPDINPPYTTNTDFVVFKCNNNTYCSGTGSNNNFKIAFTNNNYNLYVTEPTSGVLYINSTTSGVSGVRRTFIYELRNNNNCDENDYSCYNWVQLSMGSNGTNNWASTTLYATNKDVYSSSSLENILYNANYGLILPQLTNYTKITITPANINTIYSNIDKGSFIMPLSAYNDLYARFSYFVPTSDSQLWDSTIETFSYVTSDLIRIDFDISTYEGAKYMYFNACHEDFSNLDISCSSFTPFDIWIPNTTYYSIIQSSPNNTGGYDYTYTAMDNNEIVNEDFSSHSALLTSNNPLLGTIFENFSSNTFGLTSIITAPLNLIQSITSNTCNNLILPIPFTSSSITLPCMTSVYQNILGSELFNLYQVITFGLISYWVIVRIFNLVKDFKNPDHDEIEVMDL